VTISKRVSEERGCELGTEVGYAVRFDDCSTQHTKLRYMTDGMLLREAISDPLLTRYNTVILDEAHERTVHTDILFGVVKLAQKRRKESDKVRDLKIIVMSATLDPQEYSKYFNNARVVYIEGRQYPVEVRVGLSSYQACHSDVILPNLPQGWSEEGGVNGVRVTVCTQDSCM
jgi:ATP-dependent RNA helicase DHX33